MTDPFDDLIAAADAEIAKRAKITARNKAGVVVEPMPAWYSPREWVRTAVVLQMNRIRCACCKQVHSLLPSDFFYEEVCNNERLGRRLLRFTSIDEALDQGLPFRAEEVEGPDAPCIRCISKIYPTEGEH